MVEELPPAEQAAISWSHPSHSLTGGDEVNTGQWVDATKEYLLVNQLDDLSPS